MSNVEKIQLSTNAHNQGTAENPESGTWTWFDIVVLKSPSDTTPKTLKDGRSLVWMSHTTDINQSEDVFRDGLVFDRHHELLGLLEVRFIPIGEILHITIDIVDRWETSLVFAFVHVLKVGNTMHAMGDLL